MKKNTWCSWLTLGSVLVLAQACDRDDAANKQKDQSEAVESGPSATPSPASPQNGPVGEVNAPNQDPAAPEAENNEGGEEVVPGQDAVDTQTPSDEAADKAGTPENGADADVQGSDTSSQSESESPSGEQPQDSAKK